MKIKMKCNYGATRNKGEYWLLEGETYITEQIGLSDKAAMMLLAIGKAEHIGQIDELWGKEQGPVATPSKDPARKVRSRANSSRRSKNTD